MEAERPAPLAGGRDLGEESVAGPAARALADTVEAADQQDVPGGRRDGNQGTHGGGEGIPAHDERLAPAHPVGEAAGSDLQEARHGLGRSLHQPQESGPRLEGAG
jgi:hypothetical protein